MVALCPIKRYVKFNQRSGVLLNVIIIILLKFCKQEDAFMKLGKLFVGNSNRCA